MDGRVALVTGGARGIGLAVCGLLAAEAAAALSAGGADVRPIALDVTDDESVADAAGAVRRDPGRLDVLVNNAASFADWGETASSADLDAARGVMETSLWGSWRVGRAAARRRAPRRLLP